MTGLVSGGVSDFLNGLSYPDPARWIRLPGSLHHNVAETFSTTLKANGNVYPVTDMTGIYERACEVAQTGLKAVQVAGETISNIRAGELAGLAQNLWNNMDSWVGSGAKLGIGFGLPLICFFIFHRVHNIEVCFQPVVVNNHIAIPAPDSASADASLLIKNI